MEWQISPPSAAPLAAPAGEVILALSEEDALHTRSALDELHTMHGVVVQATRRVELDVLGVVTPEEVGELDRLRREYEDAQEAVQAVVLSAHVMDAEYLERRKGLAVALDAAHRAYQDRVRELFD